MTRMGVSIIYRLSKDSSPSKRTRADNSAARYSTDNGTRGVLGSQAWCSEWRLLAVTSLEGSVVM